MNESLSLPLQKLAIRPYGLALSHQARAALKAQHPRCLWLTGFSGAGKSTLANALELHLHASGLFCSMATMCAMACAATWA